AHSPERIAELLRTVGCVVEGPDNGAFTVTAPSWRPDLTLQADLVEEVARLVYERWLTPDVALID
ncbi:hypothetical protein, partial [Salmonella enterica]|uniref:hypothetical protein n=1 Tax=Salmonella enterica TaxID=28901 RepID=UPI00191C35A6